jgi:hypothetical protein
LKKFIAIFFLLKKSENNSRKQLLERAHEIKKMFTFMIKRKMSLGAASKKSTNSAGG